MGNEDRQFIMCDVCVNNGAKSCKGFADCNFTHMTDDAQEEGVYKKYRIRPPQNWGTIRAANPPFAETSAKGHLE